MAAAQTGGTLTTDYTKTYLYRARAAFIAALVMTGVVCLTTCLAAASADGPKCMGRELLEGYRVLDFVALCLVGAVLAAMVGGMALGVRERLGTFFEVGGATVAFEFVAYRVLLMALMMLAIMMGIALTQYHAILTNCPKVTAAS